MKNVNRISVLGLAMMLSLAGCGSNGSGNTETAQPEQTEETTIEATEVPETEESVSDVTVNYSTGLTDEGMLEDETLTDTVVLPDLTNIVLLADDIAVSEEEIDAEIESILSSYTGTVQVTDRETVMGDTVNIDYVGTVDGVEFDGGNTNGYGADLVLGSGSYIDTFEEQLAGHMPGDTVMVEVTFPENYWNDELAGKEAVFTTIINYISEESTPELTDEFVAENLSDYYSAMTVEGLRNSIEEMISTDYRYEALWNWLLENTEFTEEPEELADQLLENYVELYAMYAQNYGISLEEYLQYFQLEGEAELREMYRSEADTAAHRYVIVQAISDELGIVVDDAALDDYFGGEDYSELEDFYGKGYVRMQVKFTKVYEKLMETTTFE